MVIGADSVVILNLSYYGTEREDYHNGYFYYEIGALRYGLDRTFK